MSDELIDIFNSDYVHLGTSLKSEAHKKGLWHRVFTGILVNPQYKTIYLQKKTCGKYPFERPDYMDISVGGHYLAGEKISDGIREIKEEVGLDIAFKDLIPLGIRQTSADISPEYKNNEFQHLFIIPSRYILNDYELNSSEVRGLVEIPIEKGLALLNGEINDLQVNAIFKEADKKVIIENFSITSNDFVPAYLKKDELMKRLFIAALRFTQGEKKELIYW